MQNLIEIVQVVIEIERKELVDPLKWQSLKLQNSVSISH